MKINPKQAADKAFTDNPRLRECYVTVDGRVFNQSDSAVAHNVRKFGDYHRPILHMTRKQWQDDQAKTDTKPKAGKQPKTEPASEPATASQSEPTDGQA